jgi:hypothetical protein
MTTAKDTAKKASDDFQKKQKRLNKQWQDFATGYGKEAYEDFLRYADDQRDMFRKYAEEMTMPHPTKPGEHLTLDANMIAVLLQTSRGVNIMRTYIANRVNLRDVAQPTK